MQDWANASIHAFSVVHGYHAISTYGQVHVHGEELQCQCQAVSIVRCGAMQFSVIHNMSIVEHITYCRKFLTY